MERRLGRIRVEGGTEAQKKVFYTGLYHALIHPNVLSDVNGEYPAMESTEIRTAEGNRYTVFAVGYLRNLHQLLTLVYPRTPTGDGALDGRHVPGVGLAPPSGNSTAVKPSPWRATRRSP